MARKSFLQLEALGGLDTKEWLLESFRGEEALSRLFEFHLAVSSTRTDLAPADVVGKNITVTMNLQGNKDRRFNGHVRRLVGGALDGRGGRFYFIEVVPWLWFLTRTANSRIFEEKSVTEILEAVLQEHGFLFKLDVKGGHAKSTKREYCVQYRETDFNFVSRLMEEEGIFYFFKHEQGKHTLVLADHTGAYEDCDSPELVHTAGSTVDAEVTRWDHGYEFISGKWAQSDYNFKKPTANLVTTTSTHVDLADAKKYEIFDYPGAYTEKGGDGDALTRLRMEGEEAVYEAIEADSRNLTLRPAGKFKLTRHACKSESGKGYVVVGVTHDAIDHSGATRGGGTQYVNHVACIPQSTVFRPARTTPKPMIHGLQTAAVTGPQGEEIHTDEHGRVKVLFHWDRKDTTSCWIRAAQSIAGKQWGAIYLPRIGQEVVVSFLEGDPDRPLITGVVYNADNKPPYALPGNKTQSGFKSSSSAGGGGSNELRFEDKAGSEQVYFHAQKDFLREVEHDDAHKIKHDQKSEITGKRDVTIETGNDTLTVSSGDLIVKVSAGKITVEAMQSIELKVGSNSVKIDPAGVTVTGTLVKIEGQAQTQVTAPMVQVNGSGMLKLQGGITMIG
jgi:type VI secretion system secreted protein VgrG